MARYFQRKSETSTHWSKMTQVRMNSPWSVSYPHPTSCTSYFAGYVAAIRRVAEAPGSIKKTIHILYLYNIYVNIYMHISWINFILVHHWYWCLLQYVTVLMFFSSLLGSDSGRGTLPMRAPASARRLDSSESIGFPWIFYGFSMDFPQKEH
jgi:hypothetical protein